MNTIPRVEITSKHGFTQFFLNRDIPVVVTGDKAFDRAVKNWDDCYLSNHTQDIELPVHVHSSSHYLPPKKGPRVIKSMTMADFLSVVRNGPPHHYMSNIPISSFPRLHSEITLPDFTPKQPQYQILFISRSGGTNPLHIDVGENLFAQIRGCKRVVLFPPSSRTLYPYSRFSKLANYSQLVLAEPDYSEFHKFDPDQGWETTLSPGEILYIPYCWWHETTTISDISISLSHFWRANLRKMLIALPATLRRAPMLFNDDDYKIGRSKF
jgi:hypothetical protein